MTDEWDIPAGVYLPTRAWRTAPTEILLLAETNGRPFTYAFTPDDLLGRPEAGCNRARAQGVTGPVSCRDWTPEALEMLLNLMEQAEELPAQDFRIHFNEYGSTVIGKTSGLTGRGKEG